MKGACSKFLWGCFCCAQKCLVWELGFKPGLCDMARGNANKTARWSINWAKAHSQSLRQRTQETDTQTGRQRCSGVRAPERQGDLTWDGKRQFRELDTCWDGACPAVGGCNWFKRERAVFHRQGAVTHRKQTVWKLMNLRVNRVENLDNEIKKW